MPHGLYNTDKSSYFSSVNSPQLSFIWLKDSKASEGWHWQVQSCLMVSGPALLYKKLTCVSTGMVHYCQQAKQGVKEALTLG